MSVNIVVCLIFILQIPIIFTQNNRIRSPIPPLNLAASDIPMFLTITIDDALHQESYTNTGEVLNHFNPNDQQIPIVYFVSNDLTDYRKVQDRYLQGCEIAVHTVSHTTDINTDLTKWYHEIQTARDLLSVHADIPLDAIAGFRAPYLQKNDFSFQVLNGINPAFTYDSTIVATLDDNDLFDWPYTLDQYDADYLYQVGAGPADSYPGLWEIPMYHIYSNITNKTTFHIMDYSANYTTLLNAFKSNFIHRLNTNKAPMGLYFHSPWFDRQVNVDALNDFITWALDGNETWVVTNREVIAWMNNPVPISQGYEFRHSNQLKNGKTAFHKCSYATSFIYTVEVICPATFPHDLTWDANQLISTDITVSSTDNELTTLQETCSSDVYTLYDANTAYCGTVGVYETVRYLDQLYSCQWWTQSEEPGVDSVWLLLKNCMVNTTSFVRADIVPYGTFNVFENNVLDIDMHINDVYRLDAVSVNSTYNLDIFDSYSLTYNSLVNVTLSIQFNTINVAEYEINFSFRNASTSEPTLAPSKSPTMNPSLFPSTSPTPFPTKNPSTAPSQYPSFSPSMPSYSPSMAPSGSTYAPSESTSAPSKVPSISPTLSPSQDSDDAAHIWEEKFSITVSHSTLIIVSVSILLLILLCVCAVYCVVKRYKKLIRDEFEDNIVHRISVQSVLSQSVPSVFPGSGMAKPSKSSSSGSTIPPPALPALPAGSSMPPPPHTSIDIPPPPPETWDTYRSVEGV